MVIKFWALKYNRKDWAPIASRPATSLKVYPKEMFFNLINEPSSTNSDERSCVLVAFNEGSGAEVLLVVHVSLNSTDVPNGTLPSRPIIRARAQLKTSFPETPCIKIFRSRPL